MGGNGNFGYEKRDIGYGIRFVDKVEGTKVTQTLINISQLSSLSSCKVRAVSESDKHHIQFSYRKYPGRVPSAMNRAHKCRANS